MGELVPPRAPRSAQPAHPVGLRRTAGRPAAAAGPRARPVAPRPTGGGSGGMGIALAMAGGLLVLLAGGAFLVNRRWPLPDLVRRRR